MSELLRFELRELALTTLAFLSIFFVIFPIAELLQTGRIEFQLVRALWKIHPLFLPLIFLGSYVVASSIHMRDKRVRERKRLRR